MDAPSPTSGGPMTPATCQRCGLHPATVHLTDTHHGHPHVTHLCDDCAAEHHHPTHKLSPAVRQSIEDTRRRMADVRKHLDEQIDRSAHFYRSLADFMRTEHRFPVNHEYTRLGPRRPPYPNTPEKPDDGRFARHLALYEWLADYIARRRTFPRPEQILDWADAPAPTLPPPPPDQSPHDAPRHGEAWETPPP